MSVQKAVWCMIAFLDIVFNLTMSNIQKQKLLVTDWRILKKNNK